MRVGVYLAHNQRMSQGAACIQGAGRCKKQVQLVSDTLTRRPGPDRPRHRCQCRRARDFHRFRGTTTRADWNNSRLVGPQLCGRRARVHEFVMQWESVRSRVLLILDEIEADTILLVGHSGGAHGDDRQHRSSTNTATVDVITFGAPRCGSMALHIRAAANNVKSMTRVVRLRPCVDPPCSCHTH
jgi:hypothetical protein